jgi:uncharacterized protein involved in type VI secretion and phage assembly
MTVKVNGAVLSDQVLSKLVSGEAESNMHRPDSFTLVFRDDDASVLSEGGFQLATPVTVSISDNDVEYELVSGDVTSVELDGNTTGRYVIVRGHDRSHRLFAGTNTKAWVNCLASDIVKQILSKRGLEAGTIDETAQVYDLLTQANTSDWSFIQELALLEGRDAYASKGRFNFAKPVSAEGGPDPAKSFDRSEPLQLVFQQDVLRLHAVVSGSEQVSTAEVRGWDPVQASGVVGSTVPEASSSHSQDAKAQPSVVADEFGSPVFTLTDIPFVTQSQVDTASKSVGGLLAGSFAEVEGQCLGNGNLCAGEVVSLGMAGDPFDGKYVVTSARHRFEPGTEGYRTWFRIGGRTSRSLLALGTGTSQQPLPVPSIPGVVVGVVTGIKDPMEICRVKVKFPWLDDTYESDWIRTVQAGASGGFGCSFVPEVGTEVLLAFDHGNPSYPYIIGSLYNGSKKPYQLSQPGTAISEAVNQRSIVSRLHHVLLFNDSDANAAIELVTGGQECSVLLHAKDSPATVKIDSKGNVEITGGQNVSVSASQDMTLKAGGSLSIAAASASIKADGQLELGAATTKLAADAMMTVSGAMIKIGG